MVAKFFSSLFGNAAQPEVPDEPRLSDDEVELAQMGTALDGLRRTVRHNGRVLVPVLWSQLRQIDDILRPLLAYIGAHGGSTEQRVLLNAMITDYLPTPLRTYASLPADAHRQSSKETRLMLEQLATLYTTAQDLNHQVRTGAVTELSVHGRFLQDKFDVGSLKLEGL